MINWIATYILISLNSLYCPRRLIVQLIFWDLNSKKTYSLQTHAWMHLHIFSPVWWIQIGCLRLMHAKQCMYNGAVEYLVKLNNCQFRETGISCHLACHLLLSLKSPITYHFVNLTKGKNQRHLRCCSNPKHFFLLFQLSKSNYPVWNDLWKRGLIEI